MAIQRIHHVQVTVPSEDEAAARAFYCSLLGLVEFDKADSLKARGGFWVYIGDQELHVSLEDGVDRSATKAHVAYQVTGLEQWRAKLADAGLTIGESVPIPGCRRFECRDPFGNRMEFIEPLA